jgi:hypothetical protein
VIDLPAITLRVAVPDVPAIIALFH